MDKKGKILFSATSIVYLGFYSILVFHLKRYFIFLITISKTASTILSLNEIKLLLKILSHINKVI